MPVGPSRAVVGPAPAFAPRKFVRETGPEGQIRNGGFPGFCRGERMRRQPVRRPHAGRGAAESAQVAHWCAIAQLSPGRICGRYLPPGSPLQ
jgi:hypothetical protein